MLLFPYIFLLQFVHGWHNFEQPLEVAKPNSKSIYEFDLLVEHRLTMSVRRKNGTKTVVVPVDYSPERKIWLPRDGSKMDTEHMDGLLQWDGLHRRVVTINGQSPGKVIVVPLGARVAMRVRNRLRAEALTIHLHGMDKRNAWWTDGVAFVQQCPVGPGDDFVYRFIADTVGTHWYHGHLMNDRADGLLGGFVVVKPEDPMEWELDGKRVTVGRQYYSILQDWSVPSSSEQWLCHIHTTMKWLYGFDQPGTNEPNHKCWAPKRTYDGSNVGGSVPLSAILIDQKGWSEQEKIRANPSAIPLTTYAIRSGENVLLRLVNGGVSLGFMVWLEEHDFWVTAADGAPVKPIRVDSLVLFPGERYDLLIRGLKSPKKRVYRVIVETMEYLNWDWTRMEQPQVGLAQLHYEDFANSAADSGNDEEEDVVDWSHVRCRQDRKCRVLNCPFRHFPPHFNFTCISAHLLESAEDEEEQNDANGDPELLEEKVFPEHNFQEVFANMHSDNHFDGWLFEHPLGIPYFHRHNLTRVARQCDPTKCHPETSAHWDPACQCFVHFKFTLGSVVQMTIYNMGDTANPGGMGYSHPFHLHGTHFRLMKVGYGEYHANNGSIWRMNRDIPCIDDKLRCIGLKWANESWLGGNVPGMRKNPSSRDTVNIPVGGYITIRFRATNPGWWFSHCHLMLHNMGGTAFAFRIGTDDQVPAPPDSYPHSCGVQVNK